MTESTQAQILSNLMYHYPRYMHLKMYIDGDNKSFLEEEYTKAIKQHNANLLDNSFIDAGFDLYTPRNIFKNPDSPSVFKVNHDIKCAARMVTVYPNGETRSYNTGFYIHPRSSIYKTWLRLANSAGVIDAGYRGNIIAMFDVLHNIGEYNSSINAGSRLVQICAPDLVPIYVELVDNVEDLGEKTARAEGGFGSTGV